MADNISEIRKIFADREVTMSANDTWAVQGTPVVRHKALERLALALKIVWKEPKILRAERDEAVILVMGEIGTHTEWSIGEALVKTPTGTGNYRVTGNMASYVWAMAEKRGKDRVIIKLAGLDAYSEEESDDFARRDEPVPPKINHAVELLDEPATTDVLKATEKVLFAAANKGTESLKAAWKVLPERTREAFGGTAPDRFKAIAAQHDKKEAA